MCKMFVIFLFCLILGYGVCENDLPDDFQIGFGSSAYQIEGAWDKDGKGESIWDRLVHTPSKVLNNDTGDTACNSYELFRDDIQIIKNIGANIYRISLSWSRILPTGQINDINELGVLYYNDLINDLLVHDIEPMVTLFHWDLPQALQDIGGWTNPEMEKYFAEYARLCFKLFGDRVTLWTTFNEPMQICHRGYGTGEFAPSIVSPGVGEYLCVHTVIKAHAKAYRLYHKEFNRLEGGKISFVADFSWFEPISNSTEDLEAAERGIQFYYGWFINPIVHGDYPEVMKNLIEQKSIDQGYPESRLPKFTFFEKLNIRGTYDFLGVNIYTSLYGKNVERDEVGFWPDSNLNISQSPDWETTMLPLYVVTPWSARKILKYIKDNYNDPEIYVTENGFADDGSSLNDTDRIEYIKKYLGAILEARKLDNVNVKGYIYWSLMDNFEWTYGYWPKFGVVSVDFKSSNLTRTIKKSGEYMKQVISTRSLS